jgi:LytR cell envelope-related transcriptional attenuator
LEASIAAQELVRPWRRATVAVSVVAAIELVLLVVCGAALVARPLAHALQRHAAKAAAAAPAKHAAPHRVVHHVVAPPPKPHHPRTSMRVLVLNGNGRNGAAHAEAGKLESLGYHIAGAADAERHDYATTVVMYRNGYRAEGLRLAHDLHVQAVGPLDGIRVGALDGGQLAVIIGAR